MTICSPSLWPMWGESILQRGTPRKDCAHLLPPPKDAHSIQNDSSQWEMFRIRFLRWAELWALGNTLPGVPLCCDLPSRRTADAHCPSFLRPVTDGERRSGIDTTDIDGPKLSDSNQPKTAAPEVGSAAVAAFRRQNTNVRFGSHTVRASPSD